MDMLVQRKYMLRSAMTQARLDTSASRTQESGLKEMEMRNTQVNHKGYRGSILDQ